MLEAALPRRLRPRELSLRLRAVARLVLSLRSG